MTFATDDAPGRIVAALALEADVARARGLRVEDGGSRAGLAPGAFAVG